MDDMVERVKDRLKGSPPIKHWHVGLLKDLRAGKDVTGEAITAIENLEHLLFEAETVLAALFEHPPANSGIPIFRLKDGSDT